MIELEHTLIMLLLLVSLLQSRPRLPVVARWVVWASVALAFVAPAVPLALSWDWLIGLTIPIIIWHHARNLVYSRWTDRPVDLLAWMSIAVAIAALITFISGFSLAAGLLFGVLAASIVWQTIEDDSHPGYVGQLGYLALIFLLAEIAPAVEAPARYALALLGGGAAGALIGYLAVHLAVRVENPRLRSVLAIAQAYLAYAVGASLGLSGVFSTVLSVVAFTSYGVHRGLWREGYFNPKPFDSPLVFIPAVAALAFFGWQLHVELSTLLLLEAFLGALLAVVILFGYRAVSKTGAFRAANFVSVGARAGFLLLAALLLWPRAALLYPTFLVLALAWAGLAIFSAHYSLSPLLSVYQWLDEADWEDDPARQPDETPPVGAYILRDVAAVSPNTPLPGAARLLMDQPHRCLPVLDGDGYLIGILTEADLFVKVERLPRMEQTVITLFGQPLAWEDLFDRYAEYGANRLVSDVMTRKVVWVRETHSVAKVIQMMLNYDKNCLPVLTGDPEDGGRLAGLIDRATLIGVLQTANRPAIDSSGTSPNRSGTG